MKHYKNFKKITAFMMAFAFLLLSVVPAYAFPKPPQYTTTEEGTGEGTGSITIRVRNTQTDVTEDQDLSTVEIPVAGTVGYTLYKVADYNGSKGAFYNGDVEYTQTEVPADFDTTGLTPAAEEKLNTENAGEIKFENLPLGRYVAVQTTRNEGTAMANTFMVDIPGFSKDETGKIDKTKYTNHVIVYPKNTLSLADFKLEKIDGDTNANMTSTVTIEKTAGTKVASDTLKVFGERAFLQSNGSILFDITEQGLNLSGLQPGTYLVKELFTEAGYSLNVDNIEFVVNNDGTVTVTQGKTHSYEARENSLVIKNYKTPTVEKVLEAGQNQIGGTQDVYFDTTTNREIKWDINVSIPANIRDYSDFKISDTPQTGIKFKEFTSLAVGNTVLENTTDYTINANEVTLTQAGIEKLANIVEATGTDTLVVKVVVEFDETAFDWETLRHTNTAKISYSVVVTPNEKPEEPNTPPETPNEEPEEKEHTPEEKMTTGTLSITKLLDGTPLENIKPSNVEFKLSRKVTRGETTTEEWLTLEEKAGGAWYVTGVAENKEAATILRPKGDETANKSNPIRIYGLLVKDTEADITHADYFITEVKAPQGYNPITKPIQTGVTDTDKVDATLRAEVEVINKTGVELPITGGMGIGLAVVGAGALFVLGKRKEKQNKEQ